MMDNRRVVVKGPIEVLRRNDGQMFMARFLPLKLTAYGRTYEDAEQAVKQQYNRFISKYRQLGLLEERLNQIGVNWYWEDEYPHKEETPIEYSSSTEPTEATKKDPKWQPIAREFAVAA